MKNIKFGVFFVGLALAVTGTVSVAAQDRVGPRRDVQVFGGAGGSQLGIRVSDSTNGVRVDDVNTGSPAEKAGIREGDVVVEFDGERVRSAMQLTRLVRETPNGRSVAVAVMRDGKRQALQATPQSREPGTGNRDAGGGKLRFSADRAELFTEQPGMASFELGGFDTLYVEASVPARALGDSTALGCLLSDPAGITSAFSLKGEVSDRDKALIASGPVGVLDPPRLRGVYRVECRTGPRAVLVDRFEVRGKPDLPALDSRLVSAALFAGGEEAPGDEAVADVVFSAARLTALWLVAVLDHPGKAAGTLAYSCRVTGARNAVIATRGAQSLPVAAADRAIVLRQRIAPPARQRWAPGKYQLSCASGPLVFLRIGFDLTR